ARSDTGSVAPAVHANGVMAIDHVVLLSPDLHRTVESFAGVGLEPRRERDGELGGRPIRQIFYRFGEVIVEVVGNPVAAAEGPSTL
ncbi:glyoxalase, partial [Mycobacterium sp. ITM-2017-0098]